MAWTDIFKHRDLIEADLQDQGIDIASDILRRRSARWLRVRIIGLLAADTRLSRTLRYLKEAT